MRSNDARLRADPATPSGVRVIALTVALAVLAVSVVGYNLWIQRRSRRPPVVAIRSEPITSWMPRPLTIVDSDAASGELLAADIRHTGLLVRVVDAASIRSSDSATELFVGSAAVWFTNRAANLMLSTTILGAVSEGTAVVLDGDSPAARSLLKLHQTTNGESELTDHDVAVFADAPTTGLVPGVDGLTVLAKTASGQPALVRSGTLVWSAVRLDEGKAIARMPYLASTLESEFGVQPVAERMDIDLYVDPDLVGATTPKELSIRWAQAGIRRIYLSAWKDDRENHGRFDYVSFVDTMHRRGIEVYAWLEWPHVNRSFWNLHPECRERTADDGYARIFWREHVALEVPACFDLAWAETKDILTSAAFDGVNLAELYFEGATLGPEEPSTYTPFHPAVVKQFERKHGFDPHDLVDPLNARYWKFDRASFAIWTKFRDNLITDLHRRAIEKLGTVFKPEQLMVTIIDDRYRPDGEPFRGPGSLALNIGSNSRDILALRAKTPFAVQVEDPFTMWVRSPARYRDYRELYNDVTSSELVLDINVVDRGTAIESGFTTKKSVGIELARSVHSIGSTGARLAVYASSTISVEDLDWIRFALAAGSVTLTPSPDDPGVLLTDALAPFRLRLSHPARQVAVDGVRSVLVQPTAVVSLPAGKHRVSFS
jgi:hypothetical protein